VKAVLGPLALENGLAYLDRAANDAAADQMPASWAQAVRVQLEELRQQLRIALAADDRTAHLTEMAPGWDADKVRKLVRDSP